MQVRYYRDTYAEHPEDRENIEYRVHLEEGDGALVTLSGMYELLSEELRQGESTTAAALSYARLPIVDEKAPREEDFDAALAELRKEGTDTGCVFNCQVNYTVHTYIRTYCAVSSPFYVLLRWARVERRRG